MYEEVKGVRIPVFDNIRCISKEDFEKLPDKQFYQVRRTRRQITCRSFCTEKEIKNSPTATNSRRIRYRVYCI